LAEEDVSSNTNKHLTTIQKGKQLPYPSKKNILSVNPSVLKCGTQKSGVFFVTFSGATIMPQSQFRHNQ
jgi:hypothetical protein